MRSQALAVLLLCLIAMPAHANTNLRLINGLKDFPGPSSLPFGVSSPNLQSSWYSQDNQPIPDKDVGAILSITYEIFKFNNPDFNRLYQNYLYDRILTLRFARQVTLLNIEDWVVGNTLYVKIAALYADKVNNKFFMRGVDGSGSVAIQKSQLDFNDISLGTDWLTKATIQHMLNLAKGKTGLGSGLPALGVSASANRHIRESMLLRRFFPKVHYSMVENVQADLVNLGEFLKQASGDKIRDSAVLGRITSLSKSAGQSNFIYVPRDNVAFYITIWRSTGFRVELRSYTVASGLPVGTFATSTGKWSVERNGAAGRVSVQNLIQEFKPAN